MRSTGWSERALGAGIALILVAGLGAVAVHDDGDDGRGTAAGAAVVRRPSTSTAGSRVQSVGAPPAADAADTSTGPDGTRRPGASRTTRRTSTTFAHGFSSSAPLPPDTLAPPPAEEPAPPPPPPSDDVANELIAGVLDLVDVDPESACGQPLAILGDCAPTSG